MSARVGAHPSDTTAGPGGADTPDRRSNAALRELLDELLALVRQLARRADALPPHELAYAQQRLEWLADEIWRTAVRPGSARDR